MHRSVVQRLLTTMHEQGFVTRTPEGVFSVGVTVFDLAAQMESPVRAEARAPMRALARQVNETVVLAVRDGDDAVSADQIGVTDHVVRAEYSVGFRHSLAVAASGRAILSACDPETVERLVASSADGAELTRAIEQTRRQGYAQSVDELGQGAAGIAAPILDRAARGVASIGIIAPLTRVLDPDAVCGPVIEAASAVSSGVQRRGTTR